MPDPEAQLMAKAKTVYMDAVRDWAANGAGSRHVLDAAAMSRQLRQTMTNAEQGTDGFSQSMEALKHNFLLRGYFRKQAKKKAQAAGQ